MLPAHSQWAQFLLAAGATHAVDLDPVTPVLEAVFVCEHRQHPLQSLVGELHHAAAALADQVFVVGLCGCRLIPLKSLAELMSAHQTALYQKIERPVYRGQADLLALLLELAADPLDRKMILRQEYDLSDEIPLPGDGLMVLSEMSAKALEKGRALSLIQARH
jgi:hypothetical protein